MATCYVCGRSIPPPQRLLRRKVKTGEVLRRRYPKETISSVQIRYGRRVVCAWCAKRIDQEEERKDLLGHAAIIGALILLFLLVALLKL